MRSRFEICTLLLLGLLGLASCGKLSRLWKLSDFSADYPYAAKILDPVSGELCSGALLSSRTLLTAAHCVSREGIFTALTAGGVTVAREKARLGDGAPEDNGDLVLLVTEDPLPSPLYPAIGRRLQTGERVTLLGFGCESWLDRAASGTLQAGQNTVGEIGEYAYLFTPLRGDHALVGGTGQSGLCHGDSGSPMLRKGTHEIVGLGHGVAHHLDQHVSLIVDLTQPRQFEFLRAANDKFHLEIVFAPELNSKSARASDRKGRPSREWRR